MFPLSLFPTSWKLIEARLFSYQEGQTNKKKTGQKSRLKYRQRFACPISKEILLKMQKWKQLFVTKTSQTGGLSWWNPHKPTFIDFWIFEGLKQKSGRASTKTPYPEEISWKKTLPSTSKRQEQQSCLLSLFYRKSGLPRWSFWSAFRSETAKPISHQLPDT